MRSRQTDGKYDQQLGVGEPWNRFPRGIIESAFRKIAPLHLEAVSFYGRVNRSQKAISRKPRTYPHFYDSVLERFELMSWRKRLEPDVSQHHVLFSKLFFQLVHVLVLSFVKSGTALAAWNGVVVLRRFLTIARRVLVAVMRFFVLCCRKPRTVGRTQISWTIFAILGIRDWTVSILTGPADKNKFWVIKGKSSL